MEMLMNRYIGKISNFAGLRSPPGEESNADGGNENRQGGQESPEDDNGDAGDDDGDDDIASLLGESGDVDDDDFSLEDDNTYQPSEDDQKASQELGVQIQQALADYAVADADIPDDFDSSDPKQLRELLSTTQRGAIAATMRMMIPVINHALSTTSKQLKHHMDSTAASKGKQSQAQQEFKSLGLSDPEHIALAKPLFTAALKAAGGDAKKAAKAVRRSFSAMQIPIGGSSGGRSQGGGSSSSTYKEGSNALDSLFGKQKVK